MGKTRLDAMLRQTLVAAVGVFLAVILPARSETPPGEDEPLAAFGDGAAGWHRREWKTPKEAELHGLEAADSALRLPVTFPGRSEFVSPAARSWRGFRELEFEFTLPAGMPESAVLYVFTKDDDHLWRQVRLRTPPERGVPVRVRVPIAGPESVAAWEPKGHERPWHPLLPDHLLEYGCAFEPETGDRTAFAGTVLLHAVRLSGPGIPSADVPVTDFGFKPSTPQVGELCEFTFALNEWYRDPFDPANVRVEALIRDASGAEDVHLGFYYEDFLYDPDERDKTRCLQPYGGPRFKVRFSPRRAGAHEVIIRIRVEGQDIALPPVTVNALPPAPGYRGLIRRDPTPGQEVQFAWEDGTPFWAMGLNVRSPFDNRYYQIAPYSTWENEGLPLYERLFRKYREMGIEVAEVWMSSWWLGLEWINDSPGFHGVGYYNQYRAWMLDHILKAAEENGIYLLLVFHNHGKFGTMFDTEWDRNPYNVANGGYLSDCEEYFPSRRGRDDFKKMCDYIVARWGYSPNIMAWKLFTEVDLTGKSLTYYLNPIVADWHREMGDYLRAIDPYDHMITTHWMLGYHRINDDIANLPQLDFLTTDAYYQGGGTRKLLEMLRGGADYARAHRKPLLITEFGGSPYADSMGNLIKQAHLGIWTGFFNEAPSCPMYWWFALVEEKGLYGYLTSLGAYSRNEDRRGLHRSYRELSDKGLFVNEMRDRDRIYVWTFDSAYYLDETENLTPREHTDFVLKIRRPMPGRYTLEIWDVARGTVAETRELEVDSGGQSFLDIPIPPFTRDFALKIKPAGSGK